MEPFCERVENHLHTNQPRNKMKNKSTKTHNKIYNGTEKQ